jgi:hypothetical protein
MSDREAFENLRLLSDELKRAYKVPADYDRFGWNANTCDLVRRTYEAIDALLSAGKENNTHKHTVAILTEKWDEKTVTSAPFCIVCGESLSAAKENNNE